MFLFIDSLMHCFWALNFLSKIIYFLSVLFFLDIKFWESLGMVLAVMCIKPVIWEHMRLWATLAPYKLFFQLQHVHLLMFFYYSCFIIHFCSYIHALPCPCFIFFPRLFKSFFGLLSLLEYSAKKSLLEISYPPKFRTSIYLFL